MVVKGIWHWVKSSDLRGDWEAKITLKGNGFERPSGNVDDINEWQTVLIAEKTANRRIEYIITQ